MLNGSPELRCQAYPEREVPIILGAAEGGGCRPSPVFSSVTGFMSEKLWLAFRVLIHTTGDKIALLIHCVYVSHPKRLINSFTVSHNSSGMQPERAVKQVALTRPVPGHSCSAKPQLSFPELDNRDLLCKQHKSIL